MDGQRDYAEEQANRALLHEEDNPILWVGTDENGQMWRITEDATLCILEHLRNGKWTFQGRSDKMTLMTQGEYIGVIWQLA